MHITQVQSTQLTQCKICSNKAQLPAEHIGILNVPSVIAHSPPLSIVLHLHTACTHTHILTIYNSNWEWGRVRLVSYR